MDLSNNQVKTKLFMLASMQLPCYDNGSVFTNTEKLDKVREILRNKTYTEQDKPYLETVGNLFRLYSRKPVEELDPSTAIVISTHADFVKQIRKPFVKGDSDGSLLGTFDNSATNAAALYLLYEGQLPDNVLVAFTGNEESGMRGAAELDYYLSQMLGGHPFYMTLDVTDNNYGESHFTLENCFSMSKKEIGELVDVIQASGIRGYGYPRALPDEAYRYANLGAHSCSICVPTEGPMHSNKGCNMELSAYLDYVDVVRQIAMKFRQPPNIAIEHLRS